MVIVVAPSGMTTTGKLPAGMRMMQNMLMCRTMFMLIKYIALQRCNITCILCECVIMPFADK